MGLAKPWCGPCRRRDLKIVDLGARFPPARSGAYEKWYGQPHQAPQLQPEAVYGLTEFYRDQIRGARLVAGTVCNAANPCNSRAAPAVSAPASRSG